MNKSLIAISEKSSTSRFANRSRRASARNVKALNDAISLEALEGRQLMTVVSVTDFGATTNGSGNDAAAVQAALNAAKPGDTVSFPAGTYNIDSTVNVPTGVTITGDASGASHVNFSLSGQSLYGFNIEGNASNVTIKNLDMVSSNGVIAMGAGSQYNNVTITNNRMEYGGGSLADGTEVMGINITIPNNHTEVTNNYFHDSPNNRNWEVWFASNSNFDHNTFYKINDGGQMNQMGANDSFSYNYGTYMHRMGQETAGGSSTVNFTVDGNVFYDYTDPYNDTEGVSICVYGTNTQINNNYFDANLAPGSGWGVQVEGATGGPNRFGYAIEANGTPGTVTGNTLVGTWAEDVSVMGTDNVNGNKIYGGGLWGDIETEPGPVGQGIVTQSNNLEDNNASDAPAAPANTNSYLGVAGSNSTSTGSSSTGSTTSASTGSSTTSSGSTSSAAGTTTGSTTGTTGSTAGTTTSTGTSSTTTTSTGSSSTGTASTGSTSSTTSTTTSSGTTATLSGTASGINGLTATVLSDNSVQLTWTAPNATLTSAAVQIITTVGRQSYPTLVYQGDVNGATIIQLHAGWQYDFSIVGTTSTGTTLFSQVATIRTSGNSVPAYALAPAAGASTTVQPPPVTVGAITAVSSTVLSDNSVKLSWTNPNVTLTSATIQIITTAGRQTFPAVVVDGNVSSAIIDQLHPGWKYDFTIVGTTSTGATVVSDPITVATTGDSVPSYTLDPVAAPVVTAPAINGLTATALSSTSVQLAWTNQNVTLTSATVNIITTVGRQSYPGVTVTGDADGVIITGLHAGWQFDFSITGTADDGSTYTSDVVTVATTGSSTAQPPILGSLNFGSLLLAA